MQKYFIVLLMFTAVVGFAQPEGQDQKSSKKNWKYTGIVQVGFVAGAGGPGYLAQTIHGVNRGPWLLGIGAGFDNYLAPAFPIVAHGQYHYGRRSNKPFAYLQAGPQVPWATGEWKGDSWGRPTYQLKTGWLAESGVGYSFKMGKATRLLTSLGYSIKEARYNQLEVPETWWISNRWPPFDAGEPVSYRQNRLNMNRLVLKVGISW